MSVFVVTWNLNKERSNYSHAREEFLKQLNRYENTSDPGLETVRFVSTSSSATDIDTLLRQKMDNNDRLLVSKMNRGEYQGWLDTGAWTWITARL